MAQKRANIGEKTLTHTMESFSDRQIDTGDITSAPLGHLDTGKHDVAGGLLAVRDKVLDIFFGEIAGADNNTNPFYSGYLKVMLGKATGDMAPALKAIEDIKDMLERGPASRGSRLMR